MEDKHLTQKRSRSCRISYEWTFWIIFVIGTVLVIQDRWTWSPFALWVNDDPYDELPVVALYDWIARISGRMIIMSTNALFWTMCHTFANWFAAHAPSWLVIGDIRQVHRRIHYHIGWFFLTIPVLLHVWGVLFPLALEGVELLVLDDRPHGIHYYHEGKVYLDVNDVNEGLVQMSIIFLVFLPISVFSWPRRKSWSFCNLIHLAASLWFVGVLCGHHTPHFWMFGSPFVVMYLIDRLYGYFGYRRIKAKIVKLLKLDDEYMILFLQTNHTYSRTISDVYYINFPNSFLHLSHPFTMWSNYRGMKLPSDKILSPGHRGHKFSLSNSDLLDSYYATASNGADDDVEIEMKEVPDDQRTGPEFVRHDTDDSINLERAFSFKSDAGIMKRAMSPKGTVHYGKVKKVETGEDGQPLWDLATVVQVWRKSPGELCKLRTFTEKMSRNGVDELKVWGPFRTVYDRLASSTGDRPVILIASGCGAGYVLDFHSFIVANGTTLTHPVQIHFTTASIALFQFVTNLICEKQIDNLSVDAHITSQGPDVSYEPTNNKERDMAVGRTSFQEILEKCADDAEVYYCGSVKIQNEIGKICSRRKLVFHKEHRFQPHLCGEHC